MNLILLETSDVRPDGTVVLDGARARHVRAVLHGAEGQSIRIGVVNGPRGLGTILSTDDDRVVLRGAFEAETSPDAVIDVMLAVPRPKVLRRLWAQLAALGVRRIILTNAEKVERNYFDTHVLEEATYRPLLIEGLQQARDTRLPLVTVHRQFRKLLEDELDALVPDAHRLVADPAGRASIADALGASASRVLLAIGPEGGWNAFELDLLEAHRFQTVTIGPRTLRTDTATLVLLGVVADQLRRSAR